MAKARVYAQLPGKSKKKSSKKMQPQITNFFAKAVKKVVNGVSEAKHFKYTSGGLSLTNNVFNAYNVTYNIPNTGTSSYAREGDKIHIDCIKWNINYQNDASYSQSTELRILFLRTEQYTGVNWTTTFAPNITAISTTPQDAIFDPKLCTILLDKTIHVAPMTANNATYAAFQVVKKGASGVLRIDSDFFYKPASAEGTRYQYYWMLAPITPSGSGSNTAIVTFDLIFKDV